MVPPQQPARPRLSRHGGPGPWPGPEGEGPEGSSCLVAAESSLPVSLCGFVCVHAGTILTYGIN
jgi:hypothetical protein